MLMAIVEVEIWDSFDRNSLLQQNGLLQNRCGIYGGFMASLDLI